MSDHQVLYDAKGLLATELPLDRGVHEALIRAVLAWTGPGTLQPQAYHEVELLLAGAGYAVAADVRTHAERLPDDDGRRLFAELVLGEAAGRLSLYSRTLQGVQNKARLLRALYERLDRLQQSATT